MKLKTQTKWKDFLDGFYNFYLCLDCYNDGDYWGYDEFWEGLNLGWVQMQDEYIMSQPNFDPYNLSGRDPYYSYIMKKK